MHQCMNRLSRFFHSVIHHLGWRESACDKCWARRLAKLKGFEWLDS